jgi:hypothetical protein
MPNASQKRTKRAALRDGVDVEHAGEHHRLVGDEARRAAAMRPKPVTMFLGERLGDLEEVALVGDLQDQLLDVVRLVRIARHQRVERCVLARDVVATRPFRDAGLVVRRQEVDQPAHLEETLEVVVVSTVGTPDFCVCTDAPPSSSAVTCSLVTVFPRPGR